jgi:hypothetical protein
MVVLSLVTNTSRASEFDHEFNQYSALLQSVVIVSDDKLQTRVNYQLLSEKQHTLMQVLLPFSELSKAEYDTWGKKQQLSFLINAYNAFTLQLIVDNWDVFKSGEAESIRDLGSFFTSPWEREFFSLFGKKHTLDEIEHRMIRQWFKAPRIHAALVCAAVSCPPLRNEAFTAQSLELQLDDQMRMFLADTSRNEIIFKNGKVSAEISSIFKWYRDDFEKGDSGFNSLYDVLFNYYDALVQDENKTHVTKETLSQGEYSIKFKDYDWRLNDVANF